MGSEEINGLEKLGKSDTETRINTRKQESILMSDLESAPPNMKPNRHLDRPNQGVPMSRRLLDSFRSNPEVGLFRVTMWVLVFFSLGAVILKALIGRPSATPIHYLLLLAIIASLLAIVASISESSILPRIRKIGFKDFQLELAAEVETAREVLKYAESR